VVGAFEARDVTADITADITDIPTLIVCELLAYKVGMRIHICVYIYIYIFIRPPSYRLGYFSLEGFAGAPTLAGVWHVHFGHDHTI